MGFWDQVSRIGHRTARFAPRVGAQIALAGWRRVGEPEVNLLPDLVDPKKLAIDIGANWGPYSGVLRSLGATVVAFEPNPLLAAQLAKAWPGIRIERCGLSDREGVAKLRIPVSDQGQVLNGYASIIDDPDFARYFEQDVPICRLDDFYFRNVGFIKIDIEGHEIAAVTGGWQTILRERPIMLIESQSQHAKGCPEALVELLAGIGYQASFLHDGQLRPFSDWTPDCMARNYDGPVNNFIFRPA